jgi:hypothetical protein
MARVLRSLEEKDWAKTAKIDLRRVAELTF